MISFDTNDKRKAHFPKTLKSTRAKNTLDKVVQDAPKHELSSIYNEEEVKESLKKIYGSKCAYCESEWLGSSSPRVDHYRPKKFIKDVSKEAHYGYYWLSLEWTNLIQSCETCNSKKSNKFPIASEGLRIEGKNIDLLSKPYNEDSRLLGSNDLEKEKRLLLHPELDPVEKHLEFKLDGMVNAKKGSKMGQVSIDVYGLNRGDLVLARRRKVEKYFIKLIDLLNDYEDGGADEYALQMLDQDLDNYFKDLLEEQDESVAYSRLGFYMFDQFKDFFIKRLPADLDEHREILRDYYARLTGIDKIDYTENKS